MLEQTHSHDEHESLAVASGSEEVAVAGAFADLFVERETCVDLVVLNVDQLIVLITLGVISCKELLGTITLILVNVKPRALRHKVHEWQYEEGAETLQ